MPGEAVWINVNDRIDRILLMSGIYRIAEKLKQRE